jgi:uracil-DNA glycosylase
MVAVDPKLEPSWKKALSHTFNQPFFSQLKLFLQREQQHNLVYPKNRDIFNAFDFTPLEQVKVVILGQDPYHGAGQAHGLAFSVQDGIQPPPSLKNIYKELHEDLNLLIPSSGNLTKWAREGVFLLNTVLTVRANSANSHRGQGWEQLTDEVISVINKDREHVVFILWGSAAIAKKKLIDQDKHCVITSPHPSPLSAYRGFFGSKPFSRANECLKQFGIAPVNWSLA